MTWVCGWRSEDSCVRLVLFLSFPLMRFWGWRGKPCTHWTIPSAALCLFQELLSGSVPHSSSVNTVHLHGHLWGAATLSLHVVHSDNILTVYTFPGQVWHWEYLSGFHLACLAFAFISFVCVCRDACAHIEVPQHLWKSTVKNFWVTGLELSFSLSHFTGPGTLLVTHTHWHT